MLAAENRILLGEVLPGHASQLSSASPTCCENAGNWGWGREYVAWGRGLIPGNAQENFLTTVLQVEPCNFIILK